MREYIDQIKSFSLFAGIKGEDLETVLNCIGSYVQTYQKGEFISLASEPMNVVGIILKGTIHMVKEDKWGHKTILTLNREGELFGETFACVEPLAATASFYSATDSKVLFLSFYKVLRSCKRSCIFHHHLIENMVTIIAKKNMQLMEKIEITSKKTLREKILTYLSWQAELHQRNHFEIPMGRLELADYLCADRSALTRELNNMRAAGLIYFNKNTFYLL